MNIRKLTDDEIEQRTAAFLPTLDQIAEAAAEIRAGWTPMQEANRRGQRHYDDDGLEIQTCREGASDEQ